MRLWWRGRLAPTYRQRWAERFGFFKEPASKGGIWLHAVSVGETLAAIPLIKELILRYPDTLITVTSMTPTGSEQIKAHLGDKVFHVYVPYDLPDAIERFLARISPQLAIFIETELWPNILHTCKKKNIPTLIANARLSEKSASAYYLIPSLIKKILANITHIAAQTQADAARFVALGFNRKNISITGNIKFDMQFPNDLLDKAKLLRQQWGINKPVWIAASTHQGEEELVLEAFKKLRIKIPNLLLLLVPRHPERFTRIIELSNKQGYLTANRSQVDSVTLFTDIFIGNTLGELPLFYAAADIAFVGGSLVPIGGHNLLEPAYFGVPSIIGPHMFNFLEITDLLQKANAIRQVRNIDSLTEAALHWLQHEDERKLAGIRGCQVVKQNRGALGKHLELIEKLLTFA